MWDLVNSNTTNAPLSKRAINKKDFDFQEQSFIESGKFLIKEGKPATLPCNSGWLITLRLID